MRYYEYIFQCGKLPTKHTLHSLVTNFFGKKDLSNINYKVYQEGRIIKIMSDQSVDNDFTIELFNKSGKKFTCVLHQKNEKETAVYTKGQEVMLSGTIEYGINQTNKKGKKCPIFLGKFESQELKDLFKQNIERSFGVKVESMRNTFFNRQPSEFLENHIQFNNVINVAIPVVVENVSVFEKIEFNSYFQKKSYGFGCIRVI